MQMQSKRSSWSLWGSKPRERFSIEELSRLHELLVKHQVVTDANKDIVVEALRSISELMIWGDQHNPSFFDFFAEKQVLAHFLRLVSHRKSRRGGVATQILQTLSIMIQNIKSDHAIYYLFSNNYLNEIISHRFDLHDEELLAYYISFLKTISLKLNECTVQCFIHSETNEKKTFPLYTEAIKYFRNSESMVRAAVRTLTLNVYSVSDEAVRNFVLNDGDYYFQQLVRCIREHFEKLLELRLSIIKGEPGATGRLEGLLPEVEDLIFYCNDILQLGVPELSQHVAVTLWLELIEPSLLPALRLPGALLVAQRRDGLSQRPASAPASSGSRLSQRTGSAGSRNIDSARPLCALYMLSRLVTAITYPPLLACLTTALLGSPAAAAHSAAMLFERSAHVPPYSRWQEGSVNPGETSRNAQSDSVSCQGIDERSSSSTSLAGMVPAEVAAGSGDGAAPGTDAAQPSDCSYRDTMFSLWRGDDLIVAGGALLILVSLMQNKEAQESMLEEAGILPIWRHKKKLLMQALASTDARRQQRPMDSQDSSLVDGYITPSQLSADMAHGEEGASMSAGPTSTMSFGTPPSTPTEGASVVSMASQSQQGEAQAAVEAAVPLPSQSCMELMQVLLELLGHWPALPPYLVALVGWALLQLLPLGPAEAPGPSSPTGPPCPSSALRDELSAEVIGQLEAAGSRAEDDLQGELQGSWADAATPLVRAVWKTCTQVMESPILNSISKALLTDFEPRRSPPRPPSGGPPEKSCAGAGERTVAAAMAYVPLKVLCRVAGAGGPTPGSMGNRLKLGSGAVLPVDTVDGDYGSGPRSWSQTVGGIREGSEVELKGPLLGNTHERGDAIACKVAFEKGKERAVFLSMAYSKPGEDPTTSLILAETSPTKGVGWGVVREMAPVAGIQPMLDPTHKKWLHLRVRAPLPALLQNAMGAASRGTSGTCKASSSMKRLQDGRWTLAFENERLATMAKAMVDAEITALQNRCVGTLAPLLQESMALKSHAANWRANRGGEGAGAAQWRNVNGGEESGGVGKDILSALGPRHASRGGVIYTLQGA
ncbi:hypothetical protein CYMTET_17444 [Cymbomonas tetramitiformis]|uniref:FPL domain-containing protein n=1 Tax=Cymbomonas tetramitiformis TaxID=36881 RepID=A0AAE0L6Z0_9CHLO|nr:hypothetical protein CYMTET_17444 [Cymbomonas tetramitiformis]